jgi:hypothetical protein
MSCAHYIAHTSLRAHIARQAAAGQERTAGIEQINQAVIQMDQVTQQNASLVEEARFLGFLFGKLLWVMWDWGAYHLQPESFLSVRTT